MRERAVAIFAELAEAEARVHGIPVDEVHFHELADWDSIADIVGAAWLIEALGAPSFSVAPLPQGSGRVMSAHGPLPVPAPATALLLEGMALIDDGVPGERVTPTGAAILRHLAVAPRLPAGAWRHRGDRASGSACVACRASAMSCAALAYEAAETPAHSDDRVAVIGFEIDDQSAEELAVGLDGLRAEDGVLDVIQLAALGKKGRLATQVQVLARPERLEAVIGRCLTETTTIGLRWRIEARAVLARELVALATPAGEVTVKRVTRPGGAHHRQGRDRRGAHDARRPRRARSPAPGAGDGCIARRAR